MFPAKVAKKYLASPPTSTDLERLISTTGDVKGIHILGIYQMKETDSFPKIYKNFFFVEKTFQLLHSDIKLILVIFCSGSKTYFSVRFRQINSVSRSLFTLFADILILPIRILLLKIVKEHL